MTHATNYSIALDFVKDAAGTLEDAWDFSSVVHRSLDGPLSRTTLVDIGEASPLSLVKPHVEAVEHDPLAAAMVEATSCPVVKRRRKGKQKQVEESTDSKNAEDEDTESSSEHVVGGPSAVPKATVHVPSHFHKEVGINSAEASHPGKASCRLCSTRITRDEARLVWQWHTKRPHSYLHASCAHRLTPPDDAQAFERLQAIDTKDLNDKLAKDIEDALKMLAKKLPAILFYVA